MYQKEIIYMGLYKDGSRMGSAGFLKVENRDFESHLYLKVQNVPLGINGRFPIRVYSKGGWKEIKPITVQDGGGNWEENLVENMDRTIIQIMLPGGYLLEGKSKYAPERVMQRVPEEREKTSGYGGVTEPVSVDKQSSIPELPEVPVQDNIPEDVAGEIQDDVGNQPVEPDYPVPEIQQDREPDTVMLQDEAEKPEPAELPQTDLRLRPDTQTIIITEELPRRKTGDTVVVPQNAPEYSLKEDKWEQILDTYEQIHPYGDERIYVKLEPKDFVILQSKYQHLVNNSFLLHGFYNYRYIILGKEQDYYLGVPGVFYEREKMVALMFGFEAFECPGGNVRAGEFGYYLRKVEL